MFLTLKTICYTSDEQPSIGPWLYTNSEATGARLCCDEEYSSVYFLMVTFNVKCGWDVKRVYGSYDRG